MLAGAISLHAQNLLLNTMLIPDSLKENANAVVRNSRVEVVRTGLNKYSETVYFATTILNPKGGRHAEIAVHYSTDQVVSNLNATIYDAAGLVVTEVKKNEFKDFATADGYTLLSDDRVKYYQPAMTKYPYTIEYSYTIDSKSLISLAYWGPAGGTGLSVQQARLSVSSPPEFPIRYRELNPNYEMKADSTDKLITLSWHTKNMKAIRPDFSMPGNMDLFPLVMVEPTAFEYDGYPGDLTNWKTYGNWVWGLLQGRNQLTPETEAKINDLTAGAQTPREKAEILYHYMQQRTRYVSIQLGIGGFQPMNAADVDAKCYGDCKALSNYMRTLLQYVGIPSYYCEIGHGDDQKIKFPDFAAAMQTNHIVVCVPFGTDTTWLECTNQHVPFGYIGAGNSDRWALMITHEGGKLARTPVYRAEQNIRDSRIELQLDETGQASFSSGFDFRNAQFEEIFSLKFASRDDLKKVLLNILEAGGLELKDYQIDEVSDSVAAARLSLSGRLTGISNKAGTRLLVKPSFLFGNDFPDHLNSKRTADIAEYIGYEYRDNVLLKLPAGFEAEHIPDKASLENEFGTISFRYTPENGAVRVERVVRVNKGVYGPAKFAMINEFLSFCDKQENMRIILKKT